ncbi:MAG: GNAT family N-acetyltransferase [Lachnospiraceae bacterium]|nr:GNAT family N-acetyltransferase [Lachnospiraceae bacterium]
MSKRIELKGRKVLLLPTNKDDLWNEPWDIILKNDEERKMGWISFAGEKANGLIPISIELEKNFRNQGYGTEALKLMTEFAFDHSGVYEIEAESDSENDSYIFALEKAGYVMRSKRKGVERYSIVKPKSVWTGLYIFIGICAGCILGIVLSNMWVGLAAGVLIGTIIGATLDNNEAKERESMIGHKDISGRKVFRENKNKKIDEE